MLLLISISLLKAQESQGYYGDDLELHLYRQESAIKNMNYVHAREKMHTVMPEKLDITTLQEGLMQRDFELNLQKDSEKSISAQRDYEKNPAKTPTLRSTQNAQQKGLGLDKLEREKARNIVINDYYKSHWFVSLALGATFSVIKDKAHYLPTFNIKVGFQDFINPGTQGFGGRIYLDYLIASNILLSLKNDPRLDFIDTTFSVANINTQAIYEVSISKILRLGLSGGFGIGYMTFHDEYWDRLDGFASNIDIGTYLAIKNRHKIELGYRTFFYHYGEYITRKLENVVNSPYNLLSSDFARPMSLTLGWVYVF